jgi:hypothetical protein
MQPYSCFINFFTIESKAILTKDEDGILLPFANEKPSGTQVLPPFFNEQLSGT